MAAAKAFTLTSMPFVVVEAVTGIMSHVTGALSMPPTIGIGTLVDVVIFVAGLFFALVRSLRRKPVKERPRTGNKATNVCQLCATKGTLMIWRDL